VVWNKGLTTAIRNGLNHSKINMVSSNVRVGVVGKMASTLMQVNGNVRVGAGAIARLFPTTWLRVSSIHQSADVHTLPVANTSSGTAHSDAAQG